MYRVMHENEKLKLTNQCKLKNNLNKQRILEFQFVLDEYTELCMQMKN